MFKIAKQFVILFVIAMLISVSFGSAAEAQRNAATEDKDPGAMTFDLLVVRPLGMLATLLGSAAFVVSFPFSAMGDNIEPAYEKMVESPALYTFYRPLGSF
ncbi:MAG: hypothetical protein BWK80_24120 [Desulfobacteraceae bacterium IS3]|nr:MAG: hypothetical protein BWK80_24120 [Desulfobacteraceae bacterium IS3]